MYVRKTAFPPIVGGRPRLLILGSMPGEASLRLGQYYGHARNAFWSIMADLLRIPPAADYAERTAALIAHGIALWDVIAECERRGSLDAGIRPESVRVNDFAPLLASHPSIALIAFNGGTAERAYQRRVRPFLPAASQALATRRLPSTSPAYAGLSPTDKARSWRQALAAHLTAPMPELPRDRSQETTWPLAT